MDVEYNTEGWDAVYAGNLDVCNQQLINAFKTGQLPTSIDLTSYSGLWDVVGGASFSPWQFVLGGGPELLNLRLPFKGGSVKIKASKEVDIPLKDCALVVQIGLRFVEGSNKNRELVFNLTPNPLGKVVTLIDVEDKSGSLQEYRSYLDSVINRFLIDHERDISFSVLAVAPKGAHSGPDWQVPTLECFCYVNRTNTTDSFIALLMMTQGRPVQSLMASPGAIAKGQNSGVLLRTPLFMGEVLKPAFPRMVSKDAKESDFILDPNTATIYAKKTITGYGLKAGAITYYPQYKTLKLVPVGGGMRLEMSGKFSMGMGIELRFDIEAAYRLEQVKGKNAVNLVPSGKPKVHTDRHIPWYDYFLVIGGLAAVAVLEIVTTIISDSLADDVVHLSQEFKIGESALFDVIWTGYSDVVMTGADMSPDAMRLELTF